MQGNAARKLERSGAREIAVGSMSSHELSAVYGAACALGLLVDVVGFACGESDDEQLVGIDAAFEDASRRACAADNRWEASRESGLGGHSLVASVGIRSAFVECAGRTLRFAVVVVRDPLSGVEIVSTSAGVHVLPSAERKARSEAEAHVQTRHGGSDAVDWPTLATGGRVSRASALREAVTIALAQWKAYGRGIRRTLRDADDRAMAFTCAMGGASRGEQVLAREVQAEGQRALCLMAAWPHGSHADLRRA
jgi:non-canonical (house-cleaning) NTP pyrophosphatase